jgi:hypothetical protein
MSTEEPRSPGSPYTTGGFSGGARLPIPGNAEFLFLVLLVIFLAIVVAIADSLHMTDWWQATVFLSIVYILSRGIAKASRVLEQ